MNRTHATIRKDGAIRNHSWPVDESAEETDEGVVIDGYLIEDATLEGVDVL